MSIVRWIVGRLSVAESDRAVIREFYKRFNGRRGPIWRSLRHTTYREALKVHHKNQDLYRKVMKGNTR